VALSVNLSLPRTLAVVQTLASECGLAMSHEWLPCENLIAVRDFLQDRAMTDELCLIPNNRLSFVDDALGGVESAARKS